MLHIKFIIYPTDTVYGIGGDPRFEDNYKKINQLKKAPLEKPMAVMFHDMGQLKEYVTISEKHKKIIKKNINGSFTFLVPKIFKKQLYFGNSDMIGVRIANTKITKMLTKMFPIFTTSANLHGQKSPSSVEEIPNEIKAKCIMINVGKINETASTVVDLQNKKIVRQGTSEIVW